ncbi:transposase [Ancylostoma duodenale]|uniref:Transposase n=1 Tax=Ancylostoma duodenale TaxID=51022 RepID=A0A0C2CIB2_9BILA|nr:transposase [Ancylostoma duodenale]
MARPKGSRNLSEMEQKAIVEGHHQGRTHRELAEQFKVSRPTLSKFLKRWTLQGGFLHKKSPGRPRITDSSMDRNIIRMSRSNPRLTSSDIAREAAGLHGRRPLKKPFISAGNRKARIAWAKAHLHWGREERSSVLWSDESKFLLFGTDGITWIRRPVAKRFHRRYRIPTMKHGGGSCLVWGCFSAHGMGPIHHIKGIIDRKAYLDILEKVMLPHARRALGQGFIFQEDNDSKHRSSDVQQWFRRRRITRLDWPSQSLDLNIIEPLWNELKERLAGE